MAQVAFRVDTSVDFSSSDAYAAPLGLIALGGCNGWLSARWTGLLVPPLDDYYTFRVLTAASPGLYDGTAACDSGAGCSSTSITLPAGADTASSAYKGSVTWAMSLLAGRSQCSANTAAVDSAGASGCDSLVFGLGTEASGQDGAYVGMLLYVTSYSASTGSAVLQQRTVIQYSGAARAATLNSPLNPSQSPTSMYIILPAGTAVISGLAAADGPIPGLLKLSTLGTPAVDSALSGLIAYIVKHDYSSGRGRPIQLASRIVGYQASNHTVWLDDDSMNVSAGLTAYIIFGTPLGSATTASYEPSIRRINLTFPGFMAASSPPYQVPGTTRY